MPSINNIPVVRRMDDLGRVVIPKEIRQRLNINIGDALAVSSDDKCVIFTPLSVVDPVRHALELLQNELTINNDLDTSVRQTMLNMTQNMLLALNKAQKANKP